MLAGRTPRSRDGVSVRDLCNHFLTHKKQILESGELATRTFARLRDSCDFLLSKLGKNVLAEDVTPDEFQRLRSVMAKRWGPVALGNEILSNDCGPQ